MEFGELWTVLPFRVNLIERYGSVVRVKDLSGGGAKLEFALTSPQSGLLAQIIDQLGVNSAKAQKLRSPITCMNRFLSLDKTYEQRLYLLCDNAHLDNGNGSGNHVVIGFLKVGWKHLFLLNREHDVHEFDRILCVLDFYVHEDCTRKGAGKELFECILTNENKQPHELPVDNPSEKFRCFAAKHFALTEIIPQLNRFAIFDKFPFEHGRKQEAHEDTSKSSDLVCNRLYRMRVSHSEHSNLNHNVRSRHSTSLTRSYSSWRVLGLDSPPDIDQFS